MEVRLLKCVIFVGCVCLTAGKACNLTLVYLHVPYLVDLYFPGNAAAPRMALDKVLQSKILSQDTLIKILYRDDKFDNVLSMGYIMELYEKEKVDGFIGIGSSTVLKNTGYLMAHWNLPAFTQAGTDPSLEDKSIYKTLMRLVPPFNKVGYVMGELTSYFQWTRVILISDNIGLCEYSSQATFTELNKKGVIIPAWIKFETGLNDKILPSIINTIKTKGRIIFFCSGNADKETFMIAVHKANLTTPEYVYLVPPYRPLDEPFEPWKDSSNPNSDILLKSSAAFKQISLFSLDGDKVERFLKDHAQKMVEIWNYNLTANDKTSSKYALFLYDSVYLYALTLNKTLEAGEDPRNGSQFVQRARGLTFEGASGHVAFDENGDRQPTCSLWYVRPGDSTNSLWARVILSNPSGQRMELLENNVWRTKDSSVPLDTPKCGFDGEHCTEDVYDPLVIILTVVFAVIVVVVVIVAIVLFHRKRAMNQKLKDIMWKVDYNEITFVEGRGSRFQRSLASFRMGMDNSSTDVFSRNSSTVRDSSSLFSSLEPVTEDQIFTKVAMYKRHLVSVKYVQSIHLGTRCQEELTMMRELRQENVNLFIGACAQPDNLCILSEYCQKGSLQDILENDGIQLDSIFKESLIFDIVHGMLYIQSSPLKSHGNLKSSNCVIDSRWVLKITDFTPNCVTKKAVNDAGAYEIYRDKLWTAPELLRAHDQTHRGSPHGDVFSFSILLQEIMYRALPYFMENISPKDIIERVKSVTTVPFRPKCPPSTDVKEEVVSLMKLCWAEAPEQRPTFLEIDKALGKISERGKISIMDRIIEKLEAYSNNLEDIVRDRTQALREEKLKTDLLLGQMLPSIVADKLKQGLYVSPQLYDEATVYFSDILGFMEIAAESSPMEVVTLLNDLYEMLDELIREYDVYKVETISDSYMVVSGIPVPNGHRHAAEIADMSLHILQSAKAFQIRHRPGEVIQLRVGIHTGPCCAGVVGLAMPRYCLFGDTVNTASRMESNSDALKIHISARCYKALAAFGVYQITERGEMFIKGKGLLTTYWLEGKHEENRVNIPESKNFS